MHALIILWTSLFLAIATNATGRTTLRTVYQFPNPTWVENLAVRSNGHLLLTLLSTPDLYQLDPNSGSTAGAKLVYHFPEYTGLCGIVEIENDVFAVVAGNLTLSPFFSIKGMCILYHRASLHRSINKTIEM